MQHFGNLFPELIFKIGQSTQHHDSGIDGCEGILDFIITDTNRVTNKSDIALNDCVIDSCDGLAAVICFIQFQSNLVVFQDEKLSMLKALSFVGGDIGIHMSLIIIMSRIFRKLKLTVLHTRVQSVVMMN